MATQMDGQMEHVISKFSTLTLIEKGTNSWENTVVNKMVKKDTTNPRILLIMECWTFFHDKYECSIKRYHQFAFIRKLNNFR